MRIEFFRFIRRSLNYIKSPADFLFTRVLLTSACPEKYNISQYARKVWSITIWMELGPKLFQQILPDCVPLKLSIKCSCRRARPQKDVAVVIRAEVFLKAALKLILYSVLLQLVRVYIGEGSRIALFCCIRWYANMLYVNDVSCVLANLMGIHVLPQLNRTIFVPRRNRKALVNPGNRRLAIMNYQESWLSLLWYKMSILWW